MLPQRIALLNDWLVTFGGGEQVLAAMLEIWPDASVFTLVHDPNGPCKSFTAGRQIHTSFIQNLPGSKRNHRLFLPLMPLAIEQFDLNKFDLVISCSHAVAKGVLTNADQLHICYLLTPIRYAWDLQQQYLREAHLQSGLGSFLARIILHYIRTWDISSTNRVDHFVSISNFTSRRVEKIYHRTSEVIYPPVDVDVFKPLGKKNNEYLTVSRLVSYKKIDLIIQAFNQMKDKRLVIIGDGPERRKLQSQAGPNITFLGYKPTNIVHEYMSASRAFIFAALEDFGIVPVEAQACGTPVIAYGKGGALETVVDGKTGVFFIDQTPESLIAAIQEFERKVDLFDPVFIRHHAKKFSKSRFQQEIRQYVGSRWEQHSQLR